MSRWIAPLIVLLMLSISTASQTATAQTTGCGYPDVNAEGAIVLTGDGKLNTRPFDLAASAYTVRWAGSAPSKLAPGNLIVMLKRTDGQVIAQSLLVNKLVNQGDPEASGETQVYLTKTGAHYLEVTAPAGWTVTISPQI